MGTLDSMTPGENQPSKLYCYHGVMVPYDRKIESLLDTISHHEEERRKHYDELNLYVAYRASHTQGTHADPALLP